MSRLDSSRPASSRPASSRPASSRPAAPRDAALGHTARLALVAAVALLVGAGPAMAAAGRLGVTNERAEPVLLQIDRASFGPVAAFGRQELPLKAGLHEVVLRSRSGELLHRSLEQVHPGAMTTVRLAALQAPVHVVNPLDRPVRLVVDGQDRGSLQPWASRTLSLEMGRHGLALVLDGRTIAADSLVLGDARRVHTWAPQPAMVGELLVQNPLPIPVTLTSADGRVRTVPAFGRTTYTGLSQGLVVLTVRRADGGERVGELRSTVRAFELAAGQVPVPRTGILVVDNDRYRSAFHVYVDGRHQGVVGPGQALRLEVLPGGHEVRLENVEGRDGSRRSVYVDRYQPARVEIDRPDDGGRGHHQRPDAVSWGYGHDGYEDPDRYADHDRYDDDDRYADHDRDDDDDRDEDHDREHRQAVATTEGQP